MTLARRSPRAAASRLLAAAAAAAAAGAAARAAAAAAVDTAAASWWDPWRHHPVLVAEPAIRPVLLRWYEVKLSEEHPDRPFTAHTRYLPGGSKAYMTEANYPYEPLADAAARDRLAGWDLLKLPGHGPMVADWLKLHLNRDATLCLALRYNTGEEVNVPGYTLAGVAVVDDGDRLVREGMELPGRAGIWCKAAAAGVVTLPRGPPMGITRGRPDFYSYDIYLGEADGSAPAPPAVAKALNGVKVYPNSRCPPELHDVWMTPNVDDADEDTAGKSWRTWHPQVDPVYWCYYGHEHGTAPHFMAPYAPRLDYTAWKNNRQDESHPGFKGYGMIAKDGTAYYITVHASTSELSRIHQRFHTVTFAAVTKAGEIVADLSIKGDFGPSFALPTNFRRDRRRLPVGGPAQAELLAAFEAVPRDRPGASKRVNVFSGDYNHTDMEVDREDLPRGRYEEWRGGLGLCTTSERRRGLILDIKDPITACPDRRCAPTGGLTALAPVVDRPAGVARASRGVHRIVRFDAVRVGRALCAVDGLDDAAGDAFYTNAYGTELAAGPAADAVRQVLKVGWAGALDGRWTTHDDWYRMMRPADEDDESATLHKVLPSKVDPLISLMRVEKVPDSTYEMIGGLETQIKEIKEVIELPIKHPELFDALGIAQPKGVLLYGPPGTGKTLLARAVAHHTECTFIRVSGSELVQKYIGEGSRMVRELFVMAREHAPSIIFMDEIDSIGSARQGSGSGNGDSEVQRTMLELLNQLDGFEPSKNIKVLMATNRIDILDSALLRPGRIDRKIEFPNPNDDSRLSILAIHSRKMNLMRQIELSSIAAKATGASGAEMKAICTEAGMYALRERRVHVTQDDFDLAVAKVMRKDSEANMSIKKLFK